jgi:hypothetical protein
MSRVFALFIMLAWSLAFAPVASASKIHFVGTPVCTADGGQLCCSGKVAGLGPAPTVVQILAQFECENQGGHNPPGQASGKSAPIPPSGGQITFGVCASGKCPDTMTPTFGGVATINIFQNGNLVFSATIPID